MFCMDYYCHTNAYNSQLNISNILIPLENVYEALSTIGNNKKAGPDLLPAIFFQNCHKALARPVHILFNLSLSSGAYPLFWKTSFINPIFKSGDQALATNNRPISKSCLNFLNY